MIVVNGKNGIYVKVLKHSKAHGYGTELLTVEMCYPRVVHSEFMTHRMLSRNAASSRAIPFAKMQEQLTGQPVRFGQANPGMQDKGDDYAALVAYEEPNDGYLSFYHRNPPEVAWKFARDQALVMAKAFHDAGYHKQVYNRLTEPFQMIKVIVTATEFNNFFWLRDDKAADPTIAALAKCMKEAKAQSVPQELQAGEWHLPYIESYRDGAGNLRYAIHDDSGELEELDTQEAIKVSAARCAAVSFRNIDYGLEKSLQVYERLVGDEKKHGSAMEHQATPMQEPYDDLHGEVNFSFTPESWEQGISHVDMSGNLWSGNFKHWIQHRKLIAGESVEG